MSEALAPGRGLCTFDIIEDSTRGVLHLEVGTSIRSARRLPLFEPLGETHELQSVPRTDNGQEFLGKVFVAGANRPGAILDQHLLVRLDDVGEAAG